ncbi:MAG: Epoxide hydrolase, partial [uncultured Solirubrobacterales bacterium]
EPARLRALRRPGRRLGGDGHDLPGPGRRRPPRRHPFEHAAGLPGRAQEPRGADRRRAGRPGLVPALPRMGLRLLAAAGDAAADPRLRAGRLTRGPVRVDRREVLGLDRQLRPPRGRGEPRRAARQRHALLAAGHRGVFGSAVLGELQGPRVRAGARSHRVLDLPPGDLPAFAALGRDAVQGPALLQRARPRRALRGVRAAGAVRGRVARVLRAGAL